MLLGPTVGLDLLTGIAWEWQSKEVSDYNLSLVGAPLVMTLLVITPLVRRVERAV